MVAPEAQLLQILSTVILGRCDASCKHRLCPQRLRRQRRRLQNRSDNQAGSLVLRVIRGSSESSFKRPWPVGAFSLPLLVCTGALAHPILRVVQLLLERQGNRAEHRKRISQPVQASLRSATAAEPVAASNTTTLINRRRTAARNDDRGHLQRPPRQED